LQNLSAQHRLRDTSELEREHQLADGGPTADDGRGHSCAADNDDHGQCGHQRAARLAPPPPPRFSACNTMPPLPPPVKQVLPAHSDAARHTLRTFSTDPADCGYLHKYFQSSRSLPPTAAAAAAKCSCSSPSAECSGSAASPQRDRASIVWTSNCNGLVV